MPPTATPAPTRRTPTQERSRAAVDRMLEAAEAGFGSEGFERTSVRAIASAAGVPVGSLYQFFDNKEALLGAVVEQYEAEVDAIFADLAGADGPLDPRNERGSPDPLADAVSFVVDRLLALGASRAAFGSMLVGTVTTGPYHRAGERLRTCLADGIAGAFVAIERDDAVRFARAAIVCTEIVRGLFPRVVEFGGDPDPDMRQELTRVLRVYLDDVKHRDEG